MKIILIVHIILYMLISMASAAHPLEMPQHIEVSDASLHAAIDTMDNPDDDDYDNSNDNDNDQVCEIISYYSPMTIIYDAIFVVCLSQSSLASPIFVPPQINS